MKVLVTGGLGYIGSHTVIELLENHYEVIIIDNLYNSRLETLAKIKEITGKDATFYNIDATDYHSLDGLFKDEGISNIIHFAGYKAVGESVKDPLKYYFNNLLSTINLAKLSIKYNVEKIIFSSSATVYGEGKSPFIETMPLFERTNPYGETKAMSERILIDASKANKDLSVIILRYFNPVGAHKSGKIGEVPNGVPNNLMPYINQVAKGIREKLWIYGNDYETIDGTGVRDYIHVVDLAKGHLCALKSNKFGVNLYNLGTGKGTSVLELVNAFMKVNKVNIPYEIIDRRPGDVAISYADASKAKNELGWEPELAIEDMIRDSWNFEKNLK
jgi:UDP-glucose 4-epimerase